jgi:hypothetical protein
MKNSSLLKQCNLVYKTIQQKIDNEAIELTDELKWIEWAFGVSVHAWKCIEERANGLRFLNQQEEIYFYKTLKPRFAGLIDYFTLLYKSVLFQPDDCLKLKAYWQSELDSCKKSMSKYITLYRNFEKQAAAPDLLYLTNSNNQQSLVFGININRYNITAASPVCLLSKVIAMKKYKQYIQYNKISNRITFKHDVLLKGISNK